MLAPPPARAVRRAGAAGRHRPGAGRRPGPDRLRRAHLRARRDRAGADPRASSASWPATRPAARCSSRTTSPPCAAFCDRVVGALPRPDRRAGPGRGGVRPPAAPVHPGAAVQRAQPRRRLHRPPGRAWPRTSTRRTPPPAARSRPRCPFATDECRAEAQPLIRVRGERRRPAGASPSFPDCSTKGPRQCLTRTSGWPSTSAARSSTRWSWTRGPTRVRFRKAATTTGPPGLAGVLDAVDALGTDLSTVELFIHGTTLGLNAVLERRGGATGIITNEGFRDIFLLGRGNMPADHMYDFTYERPASLVERRYTVGVRGRLDYRGRVVEALDADGVRAAARTLVEEQGVRSIAICFLHSFLDPTHERRSRGDHPRAVPGGDRVDVDRHRAGVPRVRADRHHRARRLHPAHLRALRRPSSRVGPGRARASPGGS